MRNTLEEIVRQIIEDEGFVHVDTVISGRKYFKTMLIYIASDSGVTISDCARISRLLWDRFEIDSPEGVEAIARIEVSSPGLDRPLRTQADFSRNLNRKVILQYGEEDRIQSVDGKIIRAESSTVIIETGRGDIEIPYTAIKKAMIRVQWK